MDIFIAVIFYLLIFSGLFFTVYCFFTGKSIIYILCGILFSIFAGIFSMSLFGQMMHGMTQLKNIDIQIMALWLKIKNPFEILIFLTVGVILINLIIQNNIHKKIFFYVKNFLKKKSNV